MQVGAPAPYKNHSLTPLIIQPLSIKEASVVNRFIINELRENVTKADNKVSVPTMEGFEKDMTDQLAAIGKQAADRLKVRFSISSIAYH